MECQGKRKPNRILVVDRIGIIEEEDVETGAMDEDDEEGEVGEGGVVLVAVTGDIEGRLAAFEMKFLAPMMKNFDWRTSIPALRSLTVQPNAPPPHRICSTFEKFHSAA